MNAKTKKEMGKILKDIQGGKFAKRWIEENETGNKTYKKLLKADMDRQIEKVGADLRSRMPWLKENRA